MGNEYLFYSMLPVLFFFEEFFFEEFRSYF